MILLEAKNPENFRKDTPVTRRVILEELAKGVTPTAAARRVGIDHKTLSYWRQKDSDFDIHCHEAQGDFVSKMEALACGVSTPKDALNLLGRHPLSKEQWASQDKSGGININLNFDRNSGIIQGNKPEPIYADFKEVQLIDNK